MKVIEFVVPGPPVAKGRPRLGKWGTYTPEKTVNYENLVQFSFLEKYKNKQLLEGPLRITIDFDFPIPKQTSKKNRELMLNGEIRPTKKPDTDNCIKAITDALNSMAYKDDSQIVETLAYKWYAEEPEVCVKIEVI